MRRVFSLAKRNNFSTQNKTSSVNFFKEHYINLKIDVLMENWIFGN